MAWSNNPSAAATRTRFWPLSLRISALAALSIAALGANGARADVVADMNTDVPSTVGFTTDYTLNISNNNNYSGGVPYTTDNSLLIAPGSFTRIGYFLELSGSSNYNNGYAYVEFDANSFNTDPTKLGVPIDSTGEYYRYGLSNGQVTNMTVASNVAGIVTGTGIATGAVQFWPSNYDQHNDYGVPNTTSANDGAFDYADGGSGHGTGYGAMQINNYGAQQTVIAFNAWNGGPGDLGIGNDPVAGSSPNYTFASNVGSYSVKSMAIVVNSTAPLPIWNNSSADGQWSNVANWASGAVPDGAGTRVGLGQQTNGTNVDLGSTNRTVGDLVFYPTTNTTLMSSGGATLTFDNSGSESIVNVQGGNQAISAPIALNNDLSFQGLGGSLTLGGGITSNGHNLSLDSNINLNLNAANPGIVGGSFSVNNGTLNENAAGGFGSAHVNLNAGTINMTVAGDSLGSSADINGGILNIWQPMNLAGTYVHSGGTLQLVADQSGTGGVAPTNAIQGSVNLYGDQGAGYNLKMDGGSTLQASNGAHTFAGNLALTSAGGTTYLGTSNNNLSLTGAISGTGGLTQNGTGTTTLSGPLSYQGATNVAAGTLALQSNLTGGGNVAVSSGATLNIGAGGGLGTSALTTSGLTTLTANNASLGSAPVIVSSGGELRFATGSGNTGTYTGSSITVTNSNLNVTSGSANLGNAVITGNAAGFIAGLTEGRILNNAFDSTTANPGNGGIQAGPLLAYTNVVSDGQAVSAHTWSDNTTWVYTGQINITAAEAAQGITFGKSIDDSTMLVIDGKTLLNNGNWAEAQGVYVTGLTAGLHTFELRMGNGGGGAGYENQAGAGFGGAVTPPSNVPLSLWAGNPALGLGFGYAVGNPFTLTANTATDLTNSADGGQLSAMFDNGTGNLFQLPVPGTTINVGANTSLTAGAITSAQQLNLNGALNLSSTSASASYVVNATVAAPATLNLGANNTFSAGSTTITDGNSLALTGAGRFNVSGGQTMTIGTSNAATALNVNGGVFHVDGTVGGPGLVNVNTGGTIGGGGNVNLAVHINSGGTLAPGDAANLTVSTLGLADNSNMTYNLNTANVEHMVYNAANGNDLTTVTGTNGLTLSSNSYAAGVDGTTVNVIGGSSFGYGDYELLAYSGKFSGNLASFGIGTAPAGYKYEFVNAASAGGGQIDLLVVPEPSTVVLLGLGLAALAFSRRRQSAK